MRSQKGITEWLPTPSPACAPLNGLITVLNEWAESGVGITIRESAIPIREEVRAISELLGLDPLYAANEGKFIAAVAPEAAAALDALRAHPLGREAAIIGRITAKHTGRVVLETPYGAPLPRIC